MRLFEEYRYFPYITNDRKITAAEVVFSANDRCDQENLIAQLKSGARALTAPVEHLASNWAYPLMASLARSLKAWSVSNCWGDRILKSGSGYPDPRGPTNKERGQLLGRKVSRQKTAAVPFRR